MTERWLPVVGFEGAYEVSDLGRVRSLDRVLTSPTAANGYPRRWRGRILARNKHYAGYALVHLCVDGQRKCETVHALVAAAFIGPRPPGMQIAHNDGDPWNCAEVNLRYDTAEGNHADKKIHGTQVQGERHHGAKLTEVDVREIRRRSGENSDDLGVEFGVTRSPINAIRAGRAWRHV